MAHTSEHPEDHYQIHHSGKLMLLYKVADQNATTGLFCKLEIAGLKILLVSSTNRLTGVKNT
eukprot:10244438-Ditylum_brightwellii.AAC.1